jgi:hypothetical protein
MTLYPEREQILAALSEAGAFCGECGFQPGEAGCADCVRVREMYADAVMPILERQLGESLFWHFEYQTAMDNYRGENAYVRKLRDIITRAQNAVDAGDMEAVRAALSDACPRCKGSGIDPEHSSPGCTDPDLGAEPPNLEPCIACQYPLAEAELIDDAAVVPAGGEPQ